MYIHPSEFIYYPGTVTPAQERANNMKKAMGATGTEVSAEEKIDISKTQALIAIACVSFFPMMYLVGKLAMTWFNTL